jgi:hypothetical protein
VDGLDFELALGLDDELQAAAVIAMPISTTPTPFLYRPLIDIITYCSFRLFLIFETIIFALATALITQGQGELHLPNWFRSGITQKSQIHTWLSLTL